MGQHHSKAPSPHPKHPKPTPHLPHTYPKPTSNLPETYPKHPKPTPNLPQAHPNPSPLGGKALFREMWLGRPQRDAGELYHEEAREFELGGNPGVEEAYGTQGFSVLGSSYVLCLSPFFFEGGGLFIGSRGCKKHSFLQAQTNCCEEEVSATFVWIFFSLTSSSEVSTLFSPQHLKGRGSIGPDRLDWSSLGQLSGRVQKEGSSKFLWAVGGPFHQGVLSSCSFRLFFRGGVPLYFRKRL